MNFKKATDQLLENVTLETLAAEMQVSVQALRQARAAEASTSHRPPPESWEKAVSKLADRQSLRFSRLAQALRAPK